MAKIIETRRILKSRFDAKQDTLRAIPALMGDGNGNVAIANQPGYVYIRIGDGDLGQAFNNRCPQRDGLAIYVGYDPVTDPDRRTFQVLSVRMVDYAGSGNTPIMNVPPHHAYHEYGGGDDVYIDWRRLMGFRVGRPNVPNVFDVTTDQGVILRAGAWAAIASQTLALVGMKPAGLQQARYVLIALNAAGVATATPGALKTIATLAISDCPIPAAGEIPLAAVRLYGIQTAIGDTPSAPDIVDLRFPQSAMTGTVFLSSLSGWARGSIIRGGAAVWESYAKGAAFTVLTGDGTDTLWSGYLLSGTAGGKMNFAVTNAKTLTLTAVDDYNLTAEITGAVIVRSATPNIVATPLAGNARGISAVDLQLIRSNVNRVASGSYSVIVGGEDNRATNDYSTICGGYDNNSSGEVATIVGGYRNSISANYSIIIGGYNNTVSANYSIAGGSESIASGQYCVALGVRAKTGANNGVFIWGDSNAADFNGIVANEFALRARGGFRHAYDDSNYWTAKVASNGVTTFATLPVGAGFVFTPAITLSSVTASTVVYANASQVLVSLANAAGYLENDGAGALSWSASTPPSAHDILSASHGDTLAAAVVDGSIIIGNVTPKWSALAISIPAANVRNVLGIDNAELRPSWKTALDGTNPTTIGIADAGGPGTSLVFSHRDHQHPSPATWTATAHAIDGATHTVAGRTAGQVLIATAAATFGWSTFMLSGTAGGSVNFAVTNAKTLTFTATDDYNITFPNSMSFPANAAGYLKNDGAGALSWAAAGGGAPGGSDTQIQYNNAGAFGGTTIIYNPSFLGVGIPAFGTPIGGGNAFGLFGGDAAPASDAGGDQFFFASGNGDGTGPGGDIYIGIGGVSGFGGATGRGGSIYCVGGAGGATSGDGGGIAFAAGNAGGAGNGGGVTFNVGAGAGGGVAGTIMLVNGAGAFSELDISSVSGSKAYKFPDVSGTFALGAGTLTNATTNDVTVANHTHEITTPVEFDTLPLVDSGANGSYYIGGFYDLVAAKATLTIGGTVTQTYGTALNAKAARAICVVSGASAGATVLTVTGISIDDTGARNNADSEVLIADCSVIAANAFFQTSKKWLGQITYTLSGGAAGNALSFNYGLIRSKSNNNTNFTISSLVFFALGGATDTGINLELIHHKLTGWTYSAAVFTYPTANRIIMLATDYGTNTRIASGAYINWRRTNLSTAIAGATGGEGYLVRLTTTANNSIRWGYCRMGFGTTP